jgi:hypothetical protein
MIIEFKKYIIIIDSKLTYRKQGFFLYIFLYQEHVR